VIRSLAIKVVLLSVTLGLLHWERNLAEDRDAQRKASTQVEPLVDLEAREGYVVAMLTLEQGGGEAAGGKTYTYLRSKGRWHCRQAHSAVAKADKLVQLVDMLLQAEGLVQSDVPARASDYGLGTERSWMVSVHGPKALSDPDGDVLMKIEIGDRLAALDGAYVRRPGEGVVWAIDSDPGVLLARNLRTPWLPPLLDERLLPADWPGRGARVTGVLVEKSDRTQYRLELRDRIVPQERQLQGEIPYEWLIVQPDGSELATSPDHAIAFSVFLRLATWADVLDPKRAEQIVMNRLTARVVIESSQGESVTLFFGVADSAGTMPVVNTLTQTLQAVTAEVAELLLPTADQLTDASAPNPWGDRLGQ